MARKRKINLALIVCTIIIICVGFYLANSTYIQDPYPNHSHMGPLLLSNLVGKESTSSLRKRAQINYTNKRGEMMDLGYSGFFTVPLNPREGTPPVADIRYNNMFFWYQPQEKYNSFNQSDTDFIMWFQGGPGAPGTFGALSELGRWYVDPVTNDLKERCFSWGKKRNIFYIDQPIQTGFSFQTDAHGKPPSVINYTNNTRRAMEQVLEVYLQFRDIFSEIKDSPFIISGESQAGLYCPHMGKVVYDYNTGIYKPKYQTEFHPINLKAVMVGDPVMDWSLQMPTYADTLYGMGLIMADERNHIKEIYKKAVPLLSTNCRKAFNLGNQIWNDDDSLKSSLFTKYTGSTMTENALMPKHPKAFKAATNWLDPKNKSNPVPRAMHYEGVPTSSSAEGGNVYEVMVDSGDWCTKSTDIYAFLFLHAGVDMMIWSSTVDPLLGPPCSEAGVQGIMSFTNNEVSNRWFTAKKQIWKVNKDDRNIAGYVKAFKNPHGNNHFYYVVVRNAGHETPAYQPRSAYDMINRFRNRELYWTQSSHNIPTCYQCSGTGPFAGQQLPECHFK